MQTQLYSDLIHRKEIHKCCTKSRKSFWNTEQ